MAYSLERTKLLMLTAIFAGLLLVPSRSTAQLVGPAAPVIRWEGRRSSENPRIEASRGVIYRRMDRESGDVYIGRSRNEETFARRANDHTRDQGRSYEFEVLARPYSSDAPLLEQRMIERERERVDHVNAHNREAGRPEISLQNARREMSTERREQAIALRRSEEQGARDLRRERDAQPRRRSSNERETASEGRSLDRREESTSSSRSESSRRENARNDREREREMERSRERTEREREP